MVLDLRGKEKNNNNNRVNVCGWEWKWPHGLVNSKSVTCLSHSDFWDLVLFLNFLE